MSDELPREADELDGVAPPGTRATPIIGHAAAQAELAQIMGQGRLPGAVLLSGPQGIGKATLAFALARDILIRTGDEDRHRVDEQVSAGSHPNLFVLRRSPKEGRGFYTVIRVEEVRELREKLRQTRGRAGWRVAIIDSIDDCNASAANAMLKTLEEPPPETVFLLVSHRPGMLLPTIRSRCVSIPMRPLDDDDVRTVVTAQRPDVSAEALARAVALAEGRPRRAFEALALGKAEGLVALGEWLRDPARGPSARTLAIGDAITNDSQGAEMGFARDLVNGWLAAEAREAAIAGTATRARLASANELWEKAQALFADAEELNLDARQTLVAVLDAIRAHALRSASLAESR